jgi:nucleotide-binding universal stress UspA family protein
LKAAGNSRIIHADRRDIGAPRPARASSRRKPAAGLVLDGDELTVSGRFDVFLTYNSKDDAATAHAKIIAAALEQDGLRVWRDEREVVAGETIADASATVLRESKCCLVLYGERGLGRWQRAFELLLAKRLALESGEFRVVSVLLPGSRGQNDLPEELQLYAALDLRGHFGTTGLTDEGVARVLAAARGVSARDVMHSRSGRHRALLVGVSAYDDPDLARLHGPRSGLTQLGQTLSEARMPPGSAWAIERCEEPDYDVLSSALTDVFTTEDTEGDTILFYYSGHGVVAHGDSYLSATNTDRRAMSLTAISALQIADLVMHSRASEKIVILDFCHPARIEDTAYERLGGDVALIVASSQRSEVESTTSPFTGALVDIIRDRAAYGKTGLTTGTLLTALEQRAYEPWTNSGYAHEIVVAAGPAASDRDRPKVTPPAIPTSPAVSSMVPRIFISYRREDSEGHTGRLYDALAGRFGAEHVFMDIDTVPLGVDFTRVIAEAVGACDVLIAVIGRDWLTLADPSGRRRLDNPEDFVRLEIKAALERDVRVIPAVVQNAQMPTSDQLPADLAGLARRNGIFLRGDSWRHGVERVIRAVEDIGREQAERRPLPPYDGGTPEGPFGSDVDSLPIEELELGVRSYNRLKRHGIETIGDLIATSEHELAAIPDFGEKSIREVKETLGAHGLDLRND